MPDDIDNLNPEQRSKLLQAIDSGNVKTPGDMASFISPMLYKAQPGSATLPESVDKTLERWLTQNVPMGIAGGAMGFATGGPVNAAIMGGSSLISPPQSLGDVASDITGAFMGKGAGMVEKMLAQKGAGWLTKTAVRAGSGAATYYADRAARAATGEDAPSSTGGAALAMGLPTVVGSIADRIASNPQYNIRKANNAIQSMVGDLSPGAQVDPELMNLNSNKQMGSTYDQITNLWQDAQKGRGELKNRIAQLRVSAAQAKAGAVTQGHAADKIADPLDQADLHDQKAIKHWDWMMRQYKRGFDPASPTGLIGQFDDNGQWMEDPTVKQNLITSKLQTADEARQRHVESILDRKASRLAQAPGADPAVRAVDQNQRTIQKRVADLNTQTADARLQQTYDSTSSDVAKSPMPDHVLADMVGDGDINTFKAKLLDPVQGVDRTRRLINYLQGNGDQEGVDNIRQGMFKELLSRAYDPQTKTISNLPKLVRGESDGRPGPFSLDKIRALYGDGPDGDAMAQRFTRTLQDIQTLNDAKTTANKSYGQRLLSYGSVLLPGAMIGFHSMKGAAAAMGGGMVLVGGEKLLDAAVKNEALGTALHKWAVNGGGSQTLMAYPELHQWLKKNGVDY